MPQCRGEGFLRAVVRQEPKDARHEHLGACGAVLEALHVAVHGILGPDHLPAGLKGVVAELGPAQPACPESVAYTEGLGEGAVGLLGTPKGLKELSLELEELRLPIRARVRGKVRLGAGALPSN